jgi:predicted TIM-barrel fold metal-dependent hydrolase
MISGTDPRVTTTATAKEPRMQMDDMILVSIDDHMVEPPDMFDKHVPAKWKDQAPKVVRGEDGTEEWVFQGESTSTPFGMAATVGWPSEEWGFTPATLAEMRPGCFDVHERVRDMNANGVLASMCFPTMAGFNARTFNEAPDKELSLVMLQAYNDWHIDEWCGTYPGRFIPLGVVPLWDVDLAVAEVRRLAEKGCRSISFLEAPHAFGLPSFLSGYWDPMLAALVDNNMVLSLHIGAAWSLITLAPEAGEDHLIIVPSQATMLTAQDLLFGPTLRKFPALRVALSEGGIGWIPFYLDRVDRHFTNQRWIDNSFGEGKLPSDVFREHFLACFITDPSGVKMRREIGIDLLAWECDYPHTDTTWPESPEMVWREFQDADCTDDEIHKITWENACRFFDWDPFVHTTKEQATVGALRSLAGDVDTTRMQRDEWRTRNEAAGIGKV